MNKFNIIAITLTFTISAFAQIVLSPGASILHKGEQITCSGNSFSSNTMVCTCESSSGSSYGEIVIFPGQSAATECKSISGFSAPSKCHTVQSSFVACDCVASTGSKYGEIVVSQGQSASAECKKLSSYSAPLNCH